jgi:hypothetical protein
MAGTSIRLEKRWRPLEASEVASLPAQLGVYQIAESGGDVIRIGYAGGKSRFGLRGELEREAAERAGAAALFRCEVNMQYMSRYQELLMVHFADHGRLPRDNREHPDRIGRLGPRGAP